MNSHHKFIGTTNHHNPFSLKSDDRRLVMVRSSDDKIGDREYFDDLYALIEDGDTIRTVYSHFKNYDLSSYNPPKIPHTDHAEGMKELSITPVENWLREYTFQNIGNTVVVTLGAKAIYQLFMGWCGTATKYETNPQKLGMHLSNLRLDGVGKGARDGKGRNTKTFNFVLLKKYFDME